MVISNGDMAAFCFERIGADIVGFEGSSGSVSMAGGSAAQGCIGVSHTLAQSWDPDNNIQLEANKNLQGGVTPNKRVPRTRDNVVAFTAYTVHQNVGASSVPDGVTAKDTELAHAR